MKNQERKFVASVSKLTFGIGVSLILLIYYLTVLFKD